MKAFKKGVGLFLALMAVSFLACFPASGSEVVLVEDNRAACTVVMGEDDGLSMTHSLYRRTTTTRVPSRVLEKAAVELAEYLSDMGWIGDLRFTVEVVERPDEAHTPYRVLLGTAAIEEYGLEEEAESLSYPGYIYRTVGNDLLIFGSSSKGTANGVYGFLQDELGVRWFGPQEHFTVLPEFDGPIAVRNLDRRVEPSYTGRYGIVAPLHSPAAPWMRRMRLYEVGDGLEPLIEGGHGMHRIVRYADYWESNPEYFQKQRGARRPNPGSPGHTNPCWSNPDVIEITAEAARAHFRRNEHVNSFSVGITDQHAYCECEDCVALQPDREFEGSRIRAGRIASDMYYYFVNEVARRLKDEFPGRYITAIAYRDVTAPPLGDMEDNVVVSLVLDPSEHYCPDFLAEETELIEGWAEKGIILGMYYYTGLAKLVPAYFPRHLAETHKNLYELGFRTLRSESYPGWPWTGPMMYADARLWWDITLDADELLDEYFTLLYGPAAPYMQELFDLFEEIHMRPRRGGKFYEHYNFLQFRPYTRDDFDRMQGLIDSANDALEQLGTDRMGRTNVEERRMAYTLNGLRLFLDMLEGVVVGREIEDRDPIDDGMAAMEALEQVDLLNELAARHERVYRKSIMLDRYHSSRYHSDTCTPVRSQWRQFILDAAGDVLVEIHRGLERGDIAAHDRLVLRLRRAIDRYSGHGVAEEAMIRLSTGDWTLDGPNLVRNPGFEYVEGEHPDYPPHLEWEPSLADNWAYWQRPVHHGMGEFTADRDFVLSGERSGKACGIGNGTMIGLAPGVTPGAYYYLEAYVNIQSEEEDGTEVNVTLDWLDEDSRWIRERVSRRVESFGEWIRIATIARAPGNAATGTILFSINSLPMGRSVHFDDVLLRRIDIR